MNKKHSYLDNLTLAEKRALLKKITRQKLKASPSLSFPLSYGQRALWYIQRLRPDSPVYNVSLAWQILSELDIPALQRTFQWLVDRHASLRTTYTIHKQKPAQIVHPEQKVYFKIHQASELSAVEFDRELDREAHRPFDLEKGPLLRINLFLREAGKHMLLVSFHHIAVDLWSSTFIFDEISILYPAAKSGKHPPLPPLGIQYTDYVRWQRKMLSGPAGEKLWRYWQKQLAEDIKPLDLPIQLNRSAHNSFVGTIFPFKIDQDLTTRIRQMVKDRHLTLFMVLLTGFFTLLHRYSHQEVISLRSLTVGRSRADFEKIIGFFANPIILRTDFSRQPIFKDILNQVRQTVSKAIEHQDFPFELLMEKLRFGRDSSSNPNPEVMFILQTPQRFISVRRAKNQLSQTGVFAPGKTGIRIDLGGLVVEKCNPKPRVTLNNLALEMTEVGREISGAIHYRTDMFLPQSIANMAVHLNELLEYMVNNLDKPVASFVPKGGLPQFLSKLSNQEKIQKPTNKAVFLPQTFAVPRNPTEEKLVEIWQEVLGKNKISIFDNFFELGGTSLQALQLITLVRERLQIELPLHRLFEVRTIVGLAEIIQNEELVLQSPPIEPVWRDGELPLSFSQERLWFLDQLTGGNVFYNIPVAVRLSGPVNMNILEKSLNEIIRRHEVLRTSFVSKDGSPVQVIASSLLLKILLTDISHLTDKEQEDETRRLTSEEARKPFDLEQGALIRFKLFKLKENEHLALLTMHHIISDGWSLVIFVREFCQLYAAFLQGKTSPFPEKLIQFADFALWQRQWMQGKVLEHKISFWKERLKNIPILDLPSDRPRPAMQSYKGASLRFEISPSLARSLKKISGVEGVTLYMTMVAVFQILLHRYTQQDDIVIGSPVSGRDRIETEGLIGCFINMLVLRVDLSGNPSFRELLGRVREVALEAYTHQDLPFEKLVEILQPERDLSREPLFQVMFALQNMILPSLDIPGGPSLTILETEKEMTRYDLTFFITEVDAKLMGLVEFNTDLFDKSTIIRMIGHFKVLLKAIVINPEQKIAKLPLLTQTEKIQMLKDWNNTQRDYAFNTSVSELFEAQARNTPDSIAVETNDKQLSYSELDRQTDRLSHLLQSLGAGPDVLVGICMERSIDMVVSILGILKTGAAYVPMDPSLPPRRLQFILEDTRMPLLLTENKNTCGWLEANKNKGKLKIIYLDEEREFFSLPEKNKLKNPSKADNLAYVIYTSGTTGRPKGTLVTNEAMLNYLYWGCETYNPQAGNGIFLFSSLAFDFSITSIFLPLITGQRLVLAAPASQEEITAGLNDYAANWSLLKLTPLHAQTLGETLVDKYSSRVRTLILGGEELKTEHIASWLKWNKTPEIFNEYGPTEATVGCCVYKVPSNIKKNSTIPIGRPIANSQLYILDRYMNPVPIGIPGELYIGGRGLAKGYLNRPQLTKKHFVANPFIEKKQLRLFRSGDRVRYLPDGNIEFLGRMDDQIKIRGYRIEPGEIEYALAEHPAIKQAAVVLCKHPDGEKYLAVYIVTHNSLKLSPGLMRNFLQIRLPEYMLPKVIFQIDKMPVTKAGKLDYQKLPAPGPTDQHSGQKYIPPRNPTEEKIASIWKKHLGIKNVGIFDNYFDLGGHSLLAVSLVSILKEEFKQDLPLLVLYTAPTIADLASYVNTKIIPSPLVPATASFPTQILTIQSGTDNSPLFVIHPTGGGVSSYQNLIQALDINLPVYGIQSRAISEAVEEHGSIESMGREYARLALTQQPQGPYFLLGWSMGGLIAFSMASALEKKGEKVAFLGLLDAYLSQPGADFSSETDNLKLESLLTSQHLHQIPSPYLEFLSQKLKLVEIHNRLVMSFVPPKINAPVHIWSAEESLKNPANTGKNQLDHYTKGQVHRDKIKGDHFSILLTPHIDNLAKKIAGILQSIAKENLE